MKYTVTVISVPVSADSDTGRMILDYMRKISEAVGLATRYGADGPAVAGMRAIGVR